MFEEALAAIMLWLSAGIYLIYLSEQTQEFPVPREVQLQELQDCMIGVGCPINLIATPRPFRTRGTSWGNGSFGTGLDLPAGTPKIQLQG